MTEENSGEMCPFLSEKVERRKRLKQSPSSALTVPETFEVPPRALFIIISLSNLFGHNKH